MRRILSLICRIFGHKWGEWHPRPLDNFPNAIILTEEKRECLRCDRSERRARFDKRFPVGSGIQIRFPQKYEIKAHLSSMLYSGECRALGQHDS